nr:MAG TPA: hypothetical protein [Caudoviricetes sp.]
MCTPDFLWMYNSVYDNLSEFVNCIFLLCSYGLILALL